jgi:hypothetical protein
MTDVNEEYTRQMTDSTEGMTPAQRAEAYEAEAARIIDRTIRKLPEGVETDASRKLVELIVQAAVLRMSAATNALLDNAAMATSPVTLTDTNAARYRWLRERCYKDGGRLLVAVGGADDIAFGNMNEGFDTLVDKAREARAVAHVVCSQAYQETRRDEPADWDAARQAYVEAERRAQAADRVEFNSGIHTSDYEKPPRQYITDGTGWREPADGLPED